MGVRFIFLDNTQISLTVLYTKTAARTICHGFDNHHEEHMDKLLLKPSEVSELTGVGKSKTYELIAAGVIPSVRIGRSVRVPADQLRRWIADLQRPEVAPV